MSNLVTIDDRLLIDDNDFIYVHAPVDAPEDLATVMITLPAPGEATNTFTGTTTTTIMPAPGYFTGYPCGLFILPGEQYIYLKKQGEPQIEIYNIAGDLIKTSEPVPDLSVGPATQQDSKIYIMKDYQHVLAFYDYNTCVKYDLNGNYIAHFTTTTTNFRGAAFAEDISTGEIYVSSRYGYGIDVVDSNLVFIRHIDSVVDVLGMDIIGNYIYIAPYSGNDLRRMKLDGTELVTLTLSSGGLNTTDVQASVDGLKLFILNYAGDFLIYDIATEIVEVNIEILPGGHPGGLAISVDPWGGIVYATGLYMNEYLAAKLT